MRHLIGYAARGNTPVRGSRFAKQWLHEINSVSVGVDAIAVALHVPWGLRSRKHASFVRWTARGGGDSCDRAECAAVKTVAVAINQEAACLATLKTPAGFGHLMLSLGGRASDPVRRDVREFPSLAPIVLSRGRRSNTRYVCGPTREV